ncbi:tRNA dihydrouridine(16) synthase DusC [Denitratisoma sp. agr-D3]
MSRLVLAPMEGLADDVLRAVLTSTGGYDWCVTEFVRVTSTLLPHSHFRRVSPELRTGAKTLSGTPVRVQLLGSDPARMAQNAAHLVKLAPAGIDLNFGCPTPLVNRNRGGAALLEEPELLHQITQAVRQVVPATMPFSAKMRLGISDTAYALDCAQALVAGGVDELVVHGRTKQDGYRPQVRWEWIARIREAVPVPVIANGEVWNEADYRAIRAVSGCADVMLGRGAVTDPLLATRLRSGEAPCPERDWARLQPLVADFWQRVQQKLEPRHTPGRLKQWLGLMRRHYPQAEALYRDIRESRLGDEISPILVRHGIQPAPQQAAA